LKSIDATVLKDALTNKKAGLSLGFHSQNRVYAICNITLCNEGAESLWAGQRDIFYPDIDRPYWKFTANILKRKPYY